MNIVMSSTKKKNFRKSPWYVEEAPTGEKNATSFTVSNPTTFDCYSTVIAQMSFRGVASKFWLVATKLASSRE